MIMKISKLLFGAVTLLIVSSCKKDDLNPSIEGYTLEWSDEFNGSSISTVNWVHEIGDGTDYGLPVGWGNNELQLYTNASQNSYLEDISDDNAALVIEATESAPGEYHSAKLTTSGLRSFRYGKIDARIKLPAAQGMWPAFWMLGDNFSSLGWPGCGEIDILELVGFEPNTIRGNIHYVDSDQSYATAEGDPAVIAESFSEDYHQFGIEWTPTEITYLLDDIVYKTVSINDDGMKEFDRSFYLILNVAVGGNWPGSPDASTVFPQKMYVDYIRYYSKDDFNPPSEPALVVAEETVGVFTPPNSTQHAFSQGLNQFPNIEVVVYGAGGEPDVSTSGTAVDGDSSLLFSFPGGNWGGGYFDLDTAVMDMSSYTNGSLVFSVNKPVELENAEIKIESPSSSGSVFLTNYAPSSTLANGFVEYTIPLSDFTGLDFTNIKIPFACWNPTDGSGAFSSFEMYFDDIRWEQ